MNTPNIAGPAGGLASLPRSVVAALAAAEGALRARRPEEAERHLTAAIALAPRQPDVLHLLGNAQAMRGSFTEAIASLQQALAQRPADPRITTSLGITLANASLADEALPLLRRACELDPRQPGAWYNLALLHIRAGEYESAVAALQRVLALSPAHDNARTMLADILKNDGHLDDAVALYREVLSRRPLAGLAWWGLANVKTRPLSADDVAAMRRALPDPALPEQDRIALLFALAKGLEDQNDFPGAFATLEQANGAARRRKPAWNAAALTTQVDALMRRFVAPGDPADDFGSEAIFVVSLPRSGSTLTEQILSSHPHVEGASELPDLWAVLAEESQRRQRPLVEWAPQLDPDDWRRLGRRYLDRTVHWRRRRPRFTNKLPGNWRFIGPILAMLPGARIVACRRDRLETCFACYRQMLKENEYTHTFADLAAFWREFDRTVRHWSALEPGRVRVQVYEDLLADAEGQTRALLDFCALPFDPACLRFYENERRVRTPSAAQVREPLRRDTARTAKYGALLDPLRRALGLPDWSPS